LAGPLALPLGGAAGIDLENVLSRVTRPLADPLEIGRRLMGRMNLHIHVTSRQRLVTTMSAGGGGGMQYTLMKS
jgi:hypothetical protein